jgi:hypothetical protein
MCLWCAVPVRGVAYGAECVGRAIGEEQPIEAEAPRRRRPIRAAAGFGVALAATALPWTTFGEGSGVFGAWSLSPRWAILAAVAAVLGVIASAIRIRRPAPDRAWDAASVGLGVAVAAGAVLEWFRPPFPSRPSIVPWLAAGAGLFAAASALRCLLEDSRAVS